MTPRPLRMALVAGGATVVLLTLGIGPALAHVGTSVDEVPAGTESALGLIIRHGCGESSTTAVAVQVPGGINDAAAFAKTGWTVGSETEVLDAPIQVDDEEITERVTTITFTAETGNELPTDLRDTFTVGFTAPDTEGDTLFFKTVQTCETGANRWIEEWNGEGEEPEFPAPAVIVGAPAAEAGHDEATTETTNTTAAVGQDEAAVTEDAPSDSDSSSNGLAIAALVVGALGLIAGGLALSRTRKSAS